MLKFSKNYAYVAGFLMLQAPAAWASETDAEFANAVNDQADDTIGNPSDVEQSDSDLFDMSLEDLLSQEVTTAAKKSQRVGDSSAAVYVISQEEIARSSARTLPDLLRQVPGLEVFEVTGSGTAVSARGFSSRFASNLLVMVDGASIYSTSISGMFWDQALIPLQDIERIEVVRGPGGSLWGSNSVNGVINIITKQSIDTQGVRVLGELGLRDSRAEIGYGTRLSDQLAMRVYGSYRHSKGMQYADGSEDTASWDGGLSGVRFDFAPDDANSLVLLGEYSRGSFEQPRNEFSLGLTGLELPIAIGQNDFSSTHILGRWSHSFSDDFELTGQAYYNSLSRTELDAVVRRKLYDISLEGRYRANDTHELSFGVSGRISDDRIDSNETLQLIGDENHDRFVTGYIEDDITLIPDRLRVTIGSKFEHNNFSGANAQPNLRVFYSLGDGYSLWAAASRAVRTPLLQERSMGANFQAASVIPGSDVVVPSLFILTGNPDSEAEIMVAAELGLRGPLVEGFSFDVAVYRNTFKNLASAEVTAIEPLFFGDIPFPVGLQYLTTFGNNARGTAWGGEALVAGRLTESWSMEASYSYLDLSIVSSSDTSLVSSPVIAESASSRHQLRFKSAFEVSKSIHLSGFVHYVSKSLDENRPAFTNLELRASYQIAPTIEIAISGTNLLNARHLEFYQDSLPFPRSYIPRSGHFEARARF